MATKNKQSVLTYKQELERNLNKKLDNWYLNGDKNDPKQGDLGNISKLIKNKQRQAPISIPLNLGGHGDHNQCHQHKKCNKCETSDTCSSNNHSPEFHLRAPLPTLPVSHNFPPGLLPPQCNICKPSKPKPHLCKPHPHPHPCKPNQYDPKIHHYVWTAYYPFIGSSTSDPQLLTELDYTTFTNLFVTKWSLDIPTPAVTAFPNKVLFDLNIVANKEKFDFNILWQNIPVAGPSTVLDASPKSTMFPFQLNQYVVIRDPGIIVTTPGVSPTDVLAIHGFYTSSTLGLNEFTEQIDCLGNSKSLFISTQLFFVHISQPICDVRITLVHSTVIGENLFSVTIETDCHVEIVERKICVTASTLDLELAPIVASSCSMSDIIILEKTVYVNGIYLMTYAFYVDNVTAAIALGQLAADQRQVPLQLVDMLLFGAIAPAPDLTTVIASTDAQRAIVNAYQNILLKIS